MLKHFLFFFLCLPFFLEGCASQTKQEQDRQNTLWAQNEQRLVSLEKNVTQLNEQVSILNNRVYEVRGYKGKKTGMTVVPVLPTMTAQAQDAKVSRPVMQPHPAPTQPEKKRTNAKPHIKNEPKTPRQAQPAVQGSPAQGSASAPASQPSDLARFQLPPENTVAPGQPMLPPTLPLEQGAQQSTPLPPSQAASPAPAPQASKQASSAQPTPRRAQQGEEASYKEALALARSGKSQAGIQKFNEFLSKYPNGKYAPNAEFWLGECYYSQGKYKEALNQYSQVNAKYPKHHKNADALLKSSMSYKRMGDTANAKATYSKLMQEFPRSEAAQRARSGR
ncbi:MAG: tol-pal system protein YbgF [Desulfovibrio sp.]|nr:tol-pal system protein YbgF [Desulfovibrio sp.]